MKRGGILNAELARAIASMGHGDGLLVVDAGFPIPTNSWRIDLALARDQPDLRTVLNLIGEELIVEGLVIADEVATHNPPLRAWLEMRWPDISPSSIAHSQMLATAAARAKVVVRTGAFDPWGNVLLTSGVDVPAWFSRAEVVVPDYYKSRMAAGERT